MTCLKSGKRTAPVEKETALAKRFSFPVKILQRCIWKKKESKTI